jgi:hypothetical protein
LGRARVGNRDTDTTVSGIGKRRYEEVSFLEPVRELD